MLELNKKYGLNKKFNVRFLTVYIEEAHASNDWNLKPNKINNINPFSATIPMHKSIDERISIAKKFIIDFSYDIPLVCDSMESEAMERYMAWPERLFIVEYGKIVYLGDKGPFGYKPEEVKAWLEERFRYHDN